MVHQNHHHDGADSSSGGSASGGPDQDQPDAPDTESLRDRTRILDGTVDTGWLRPHTYRRLGHPRVSTIVLLMVWIAVVILYLEVHPG
jgi:hypothetical protein